MARAAGAAYAASMSSAVVAPFTAEDLLWLPEQLGGHVELDPWGNAVVSPASDPHVLAVTRLAERLVLGLQGSEALVVVQDPAWRVPGGSGYTTVPDVVVLPGPGLTRDPDHAWHLRPPPLLVVEVASPSTRVIDRTRKADDYRLGGAGQYLLVDLPGLAPVDAPALELWTPTGRGWTTAASGPAVAIEVAGRRVVVEAAALADHESLADQD